jgi:hypothetical protein
MLLVLLNEADPEHPPGHVDFRQFRYTFTRAFTYIGIWILFRHLQRCFDLRERYSVANAFNP